MICTLSMSCGTCSAESEKTPPVHEMVKCAKEDLSNYFPKVVVKPVLMKADISAEKAEIIAEDLSNKDGEIEKIVKDKYSKLDPNPLNDPSQRDVAIKVYRESLFQVFSKPLKAQGINDDDKIRALLDEIQRTKSKLFIECIRKETSIPSSPQAAK